MVCGLIMCSGCSAVVVFSFCIDFFLDFKICCDTLPSCLILHRDCYVSLWILSLKCLLLWWHLLAQSGQVSQFLSCEETFGLFSVNGLDMIVVFACKN